MDNTENCNKQQIPDNLIADQRIFDNIMLPVFFAHDAEDARQALQEILRTLLDDPELAVEQFHAEHVLSNIGYHSIRIDVWARDGNRRQLALELQKVTDEEVYPRAAFEGATMLVHSLESGQPYAKIDKVVVIFVTEKDLEDKGEPVYLYKSTQNGKPGGMTQAAPTYVFVNGSYRNDQTKLGKVIADIMEPNSAKMKTPLLRARMNTLKNTVEGRKQMQTALEKYVEEQSKRVTQRALFGLVKEGKLAIVDAAKAVGMSPQAFEQDMLAVDVMQSASTTD